MLVQKLCGAYFKASWALLIFEDKSNMRVQIVMEIDQIIFLKGTLSLSNSL